MSSVKRFKTFKPIKSSPSINVNKKYRKKKISYFLKYTSLCAFQEVRNIFCCKLWHIYWSLKMVYKTWWWHWYKQNIKQNFCLTNEIIQMRWANWHCKNKYLISEKVLLCEVWVNIYCIMSNVDRIGTHNKMTLLNFQRACYHFTGISYSTVKKYCVSARISSFNKKLTKHMET